MQLNILNKNLSYREAIRKCDDLVREFKRENPGLRSNTKLMLKQKEIEGKASENFLIMLNSQIRKYGAQIFELRKKTERPIYNSLEERISIKKWFVQNMKFANCGELIELMQHKLLKMGIPVNKVAMHVNYSDSDWHRTSKKLNEHGILVFSPRNFNNYVELPPKWEKKSIVIDPWLGKAGKAEEMLKKYEDIFEVKDKDEYMCFQKVDNFDIYEYASKNNK